MQPIDYEEGQKLTRTHVCAACGAPLTLPWGGSYGINSYIVRCGENPDHNGIVKAKSTTQCAKERLERMGATDSDINEVLNIRRKEKLEMQGQQALVPFLGKTALTQAQATHILQTCWPGAPMDEVRKAALLCYSYQLNPLMKHVFLIRFKGKEGVTWATVMGITATRLIASRKGPYGYADGPRIMTAEEQQAIRGEIDEANIWAITILRDAHGNTAPGYGSWPRDKDPYGLEVGNSKLNMAMIRSERRAFERLCPGEMPAVADVVDEGFMPNGAEEGEGEIIRGTARVVDHETGEIQEELFPSERPFGADEGRNTVPPKDRASEPQVKAIDSILGKLSVDKPVFLADLKARFDADSTKDLTVTQASTVYKELQKALED